MDSMFLVDDLIVLNILFSTTVKPYLLPDSTSSDMTVTQGEDLTLRCNGTGLPKPVIEWTRLGNALLPIGTERYQVRHLVAYGAIQVLRNFFSWKFDTPPPPRNANNVEPNTFVTLCSRKSES